MHKLSLTITYCIYYLLGDSTAILTHWGRNKYGRHFRRWFSKSLFSNESFWFLIQISWKCDSKGPIASWRRTGDEPMMANFCDVIWRHYMCHNGLNNLTKQGVYPITHTHGYTPHFQIHFREWNHCILFKISHNFVPMGPTDNSPAVIQVLAWSRTCDQWTNDDMITDANMCPLSSIS